MSLPSPTPFHGADTRGTTMYATNHRVHLLASLRHTYEKTRLWLGEAAFGEAAGHYVNAHSPPAGTLDACEEAFDKSLETFYPDDPEVAELAWLDRALRRGFIGPEAVPLGLDGLDADDWERVEFEFVPTLRFRHVRSNAAAIWQAIALERAPPALALYDVDAGIRVWRQGFSPRFASITGAECACLDLALAGATFGEICESLTRLHEPGLAAHQAGALLRAWVDEGLILRLRAG